MTSFSTGSFYIDVHWEFESIAISPSIYVQKNISNKINFFFCFGYSNSLT